MTSNLILGDIRMTYFHRQHLILHLLAEFELDTVWQAADRESSFLFCLNYCH